MLTTLFGIFKDLFCVCLALACGTLSFRYLSTAYRILFMQIVVYLVTYSLGCMFKKYNNFIYNMGTFLEITLLLLSVQAYIRLRWISYVLLFLYSCYVTIYILQLKENLFLFANYSYVTGGIAVVIGYLFVLYKSFTTTISIHKKVSGVCVSLGLLIYFGCNVPNFSMIKYLNNHKTNLGMLIFNALNDSSANIRYFLMAYAFWCLRKHSHKPISLHHE
jgi:hypothetical protein